MNIEGKVSRFFSNLELKAMIYQNKLLILAACFLLQINIATACSCGWNGPFMEAAENASFVGIVQIHSKHGSSMKASVLEVFRGSESRKEITIWGDNGFLCRPYVSWFPIGSTWLVVLSQERYRPNNREDYSISICGEQYLRVRNNKVRGEILSTGRDPNTFPRRIKKVSIKTAKLKLMFKKEGE